MANKETHYDVMRTVGEGWDFRQDFIRALMIARPERKEMTFFHMLAGKMPDKTGNYFCPVCDRLLHEETCQGFEDHVWRLLKREIVDEYIHPHCPDCETQIEDQEPIQEIDPDGVGLIGEEEDIQPVKIDSERKTRYNPCGCLHEPGEEKILWDIDKEEIQAAADNGELGLRDFDHEKVFKPQDGLTEFERRVADREHQKALRDRSTGS